MTLTPMHYTLIATAVVVLYFILVYNTLVSLKNNVKESASDIEVQMKRRYELIPNLVETVKAYAKHEKETLENITAARNVAGAAQGKASLEEQVKNDNALSGTLKTLFAVSENYPDLKANENFIALQDELTDTENRMQSARRFYNMNVRAMKIAIEQFPKNIIAKLFGFKTTDFFVLDETEQAAKQPVKVQF